MKRWNALPVILLLFLISGCASIPLPKTEAIHIDRFEAYETADGVKIFPASIDETIPDVDILAINGEIISLLEDRILKIKDPQKRLIKLTDILTEKIKYDTMSDSYGIKTAQETFDTGTGNCLSFSNLFIAMSRYAGFKSTFAEIPTLPNWIRDGEVLFFTRHIGVSADIFVPSTQIIQIRLLDDASRVITIDNYLRYYLYPQELVSNESKISAFNLQTIPDNRAFAQYYNNIGSKYIAEGNYPDAFRYFVKAIKTDPKLSFPWSNLGVIYKKNGQFDAAEAAYYQGISVVRGSQDTSIITIMNNLAYLYNATGNKEKGLLYKKKVVAFREKNPYFQYAAGKTAYYDSLYENAVDYFKKTIRLKNDEHLFHYGLALAYMKTGDIRKAELSIERAIKYAQDMNKRIYYENVLNRLKDEAVF